MKFALVIALSMVATASFAQSYNDSADLPASSQNIKIASVREASFAIETRLAQIPGCVEGEMYPCTVEVGTKFARLQKVDVSFTDGVVGNDEAGSNRHITFTLPAGSSPKLSVSTETRTIQVVDAAASNLCNLGEAGEAAPGCNEVLRYKPATITVKHVKVSSK